MVQTREKTKGDHSVMRQLLASGARVPPITVFKSLPMKTDLCSIKKDETIIINSQHNIDNSITIELIEVDDKGLTDFNDIDLSSTSELFPEIGLTLTDLNDIDDMVTSETTASPDYSKSVLNTVQIPSTPECVESVMSCSFPRGNDALFTLFNRGDDATSPCLVSSPTSLPTESSERGSPMQICSSSGSDSEVAASPPPVRSSAQSPTETSSSATIKSLLSRPPVNVSAPSVFPMVTPTATQPAPMIPTTVQASAAIPLSVLAMGDDDEAVEAQKKLQELEGENHAESSSPVESSDEDDIEDEPVKPVRRKWTKTTARTSVPKAKRERKASSVSSDQEFDMDMDDADFEFGEDGERIERRRHNNRVAAQRCRQRKREYHVSLTKEIQQWECNNTALKYDIHVLQKELQDLQNVLQQHQAECTADPAELAAAGAKKPKKKSKKRSRSHKHKG